MRRVGLCVVGILSLVSLAGTVGCSSGTTPPSAPAQGSLSLVWPVPADASAAATRAGLPMLGQEMLEVHYHAHVDVIISGLTVQVPADIGIDTKRQRISPLHTHDTTGIVHIESAQDIPFTLGQFFTEWGQPLTTNRVGTVTAGPGEQVRVYRNGSQVSGDPAMVKFNAHDEIVVWLGQASDRPHVPSSYTFPPGL